MASRREFLQKSILAGVGLTVLGKSALNAEGVSQQQLSDAGPQTYTLPPLPYAYDALEPWIDVKTMQVHHDKHHQAYVDNLNKALKAKWEKEQTPANPTSIGMSAPAGDMVAPDPNAVPDNLSQLKSLEELIAGASKLEMPIRNNGGGHWNHTFFWEIMKPAPAAGTVNAPSGKLAEAITMTFGSFDKFKEQFVKAAKERFGSGWAWLVMKEGNLVITSTPNQDNPLMDVAEVQGKPILGLDVWEHAYYLKYQNVRADYINNWWNLVNWEKVAEHYEK